MLKKIGAGRRRMFRGRSRKFAIGLGLALVLGIVGTAYAEIYGDPFGLVAVGTTASDNPNAQYLAIGNGGTASNSSCISPIVPNVPCLGASVNTTGNAYGAGGYGISGIGNASAYGSNSIAVGGAGCASGGSYAISGTGCASSGSIAISAIGCATAGQIAISGTTCDADGGDAAISTMGNAYGRGYLAISGTGNAYSWSTAISGTGYAGGYDGNGNPGGSAGFLALSGLGDARSDRKAVSGTGNSTAEGGSGSLLLGYDPAIAVSGTGTATAQGSYYFPGPFIAVSGTNDASGRDVSISGTGCANGGIEIDPACGL